MGRPGQRTSALAPAATAPPWRIRPSSPYRGSVTDPPTTDPIPRPRSTLRVLATLLAVALLASVALISCVRAYVGSVPPRTVSIPRAELTPGVPKFVPITSFGADGRSTHGVWLMLQADGTPTAFSSRGPERGCFVAYRADQSAFRDGCTQSLFAPDGSPLTGEASRGLDAFRVTSDPTSYIVNLERTMLGPCRHAGATGCSRPGAPAERQTPR